MKKQRLFIFSLILGVSACSDKDESYYLNHIDEAQSKMKQCKVDLAKAMKSKDETEFMKLTDSKSECSIVDKALSKHRQKQWEIEIQEKKVKDDAELANIKAEIQQQYGSQSWQDFTKSFIKSKCDHFSYDKKCQAMFALYEEKTKLAITEMRKKSLDELLADKELYCKQDQRLYSTCDVWQTAVGEQAKQVFSQLTLDKLYTLKDKYPSEGYPPRQPNKAWSEVFDQKEKEFVQLLTEKYDNLRSIYNICVDQVKQEKDWQKQLKVIQGVPCSQAKQARSKLNLPYDDFTTKMEQ